jgi:hypothetical protein
MPGQAKKFARPHLNRKKLGMVACTCYFHKEGKLKIGGLFFRPAKNETLSPNNQSKRAGGVAKW